MLDEINNGVERVLAEFKDPETGRSALQLDQIRDIHLDTTDLSLTLALTTHSAPIWDDVRSGLEEQLRNSLPQLSSVTIHQTVHERPVQPLGEIGLAAKSVIAVGSGKGGVGKSTIATSLALALKRSGCKVGLMDADIYGPSVPHLLGLTGKPEAIDNKLVPIDKDGMAVMSMAFFVPANEAVVWRGPMLHGAVTQFLRDVLWGDLDYLIIDMPPGTGDVALTMSQLLPLSGAVVVCTPQKVAQDDARRAIAMFQQLNIPLLGVVENMSYFVGDDGKEYDIFGRGGAIQMADQMNVPALGTVPINMAMRINSDSGDPSANFDDPQLSVELQRMTQNVAGQISVVSHDPAFQQPTISVT